MATTVELLTAEEYARLPDDRRPTELVRGKVVEMNVPTPKHGKICLRVGRLLGEFADSNDLGHVVVNDSGVVTGRNPDTVRGADVSFYSYARVPKGPLPDGYLPVAPELVVEVLSPDDRWRDVHTKTLEYLNTDVSIVCLIDPRTESVHLYDPEQSPRVFAKSDELEFPEIFAGLRFPVAKLFE